MKFFFGLLLAICFLSATSGFCHEHKQADFCEEYSVAVKDQVMEVDLENLEINSEGMFIKTSGEWLQISPLSRGDNGKFQGKLSRASFTWRCPKCSHENGPFRKVCGGCGYDPQRRK